MKQYDYMFLKEEVREGFYIPGFMKRFWAAQIEVLKDFDEFCKKNNLKWFASYGTLLGAVRHKGYIPWDDDIDVCMFRDDYDLFLELAEKKLSETYRVKSNFMEGKNLCFLTRFYNSDVISLDRARLEKYKGCPLSVGIDVFPIDNVSNDSELEKERDDEFNRVFKELEKIVDNPSQRSKCQDIINKLDNICRRFNDEKCSKVCVVSELGFGHGEIPIERESLENIVCLPFEYINVNAPANYDKYLRYCYGDYTKIDKTGGAHNYPVYEDNLNILFNAFEGNSPFTFSFNEDSFKSNQREVYNKNLNLIEKYHSFLKIIINEIETKSIDDNFLQTLSSMQDMAISIGTSIENIQGEGTDLVGYLEQCCELLYLLHQFYIGEMIDINAVMKNLLTVISELEQFFIDRANKKNVVILVAFQDEMELALKIKEKELAEKRNVIILSLPYYERNIDGSLGEIHYTNFDSKMICSVDNYDIRKNHPDIIYTFNGCDQTSQTICIKPDYFTCNIRNYTSQLVYIQPFTTDEIEDDSHRMKKMMKHYFDIPGMIYADKIVLQSKNMCNRCIEFLTGRYGEQYRDIFKRKIEF